MLDRPKLLFGTLTALAALFAGLHVFGSAGATDAGVDLGQRIANISTPLFELTILAMIVLGVVYLVRRRRRSKTKG